MLTSKAKPPPPSRSATGINIKCHLRVQNTSYIITGYNECESNPCENGGTCTDLIGDFSCNCPPGLTGPTCDINIGVCQSNSCANGGTCINLGSGSDSSSEMINTFSCNCAAGFTGSTCTIKCESIIIEEY